MVYGEMFSRHYISNFYSALVRADSQMLRETALLAQQSFAQSVCTNRDKTFILEPFDAVGNVRWKSAWCSDDTHIEDCGYWVETKELKPLSVMGIIDRR